MMTPLPMTPLPMTPLIEARGIGKVFEGGMGRADNVALRDLSLSIFAERPAITAVVGESGSGKTTLARSLLGLATPSSGEVLYMGQDLRHLSGRQQRDFRRDVQAIFQDPYEVYNPFYRVDHVLTTPVAKFGLARSRAEGRRLIEDALRAVGLRPEEILGRFPHQLSGGQRQRIMVARAVLVRPKLIVADEPVSMVDASLRATILTSLRRLHETLGISIIYITHDLATAYQVSDNIVVMYRAGVAEAGDVELVVKAPQHPYTQLLIASIPQVSTTRDWLDGGEDAGGRGIPAAGGCSFVPRCPVSMAACATTVPPLFRVDPTRAAACLRLQHAPVLDRSRLGDVLTTGAATAEAPPARSEEGAAGARLIKAR
jgi:oligopeptide/dipeptide ABC transporter ATP-binding protein